VHISSEWHQGRGHWCLIITTTSAAREEHKRVPKAPTGGSSGISRKVGRVRELVGSQGDIRSGYNFRSLGR